MSLPQSLGWVEPATPIRGLDHLGVQGPCVALYAQLLPGITNVTDRARYYSFHPWLIRSFEQRYKDHSADEFCRVLRRAECLFALSAIRHARVQADDEGRHGGFLEDQKSMAPEDYAGLELQALTHDTWARWARRPYRHHFADRTGRVLTSRWRCEDGTLRGFPD